MIIQNIFYDIFKELFNNIFYKQFNFIVSKTKIILVYIYLI